MKKRFTNTVILMLLSLPVWAVDGYWIEQSPLPEPRSRHAAVAVDGMVYLSGGRTSGPAMSATRSQLWAYAVTTDEWHTNLPDMPGPRQDHVMVAMGDTLWVFGGRHHNDMVASVIFWKIGSETWQNAGEMPLSREGMGVMTYGGRIYLIGGKASHAMWAPPSTQVDVFDPHTRQWTDSDTLHQARVGFAWAARGDTIMCAGGRFLDPLASVERRIDGNAWESATPLNGPRSDGAAVFFQGDFILLGGIGSEGQAGNNQVFDGTTWQPFESNLLPRFEETAVVVEDAIMVMGGRNGNQLLSSTEQFIPTTGTVREPEIPAGMALLTAYPNPFNGAVRLSITLPETVSDVSELKIYNLRGQLIYQRAIQSRLSQQSFILTGADLGASGVYLVALRYKTQQGTRHQVLHKLTYLK